MQLHFSGKSAAYAALFGLLAVILVLLAVVVISVVSVIVVVSLLLFCFRFTCVIHSSAFAAAVRWGRRQPAAAGAAGATVRGHVGEGRCGYKCHFAFSDILEFKLPQATHKCRSMCL